MHGYVSTTRPLESLVFNNGTRLSQVVRVYVICCFNHVFTFTTILVTLFVSSVYPSLTSFDGIACLE